MQATTRGSNRVSNERSDQGTAHPNIAECAASNWTTPPTGSNRTGRHRDSLWTMDFDLERYSYVGTAGPNRLWCADIKYVRTWQGWLYLAAVMDC